MEAQHTLNYLLNIYPFVKTQKSRDDPTFIRDRISEYNLMSNQRTAVQFCKSLHGIKHSNISKLNQTDKDNITQCLIDNYISHDQNYFGKRDVIFLDLWE